MLPRLTETCKFPIPSDTFKRCQLCGFTSNDICDFHMWREAGDEGQADEDSPVLITCRQKACDRIIGEHPRVYYMVQWSRGGAGRLMLLCGDCPFRSDTRCTHPNLKVNGGEGLNATLTPVITMNVHFSDGRYLTGEDLAPVTACEGHPTRKPPEEAP